MSILDNYNELYVQNFILRTQLEVERTKNAVLSTRFKKLEQRYINLVVETIVTPPKVVYKLHDKTYGADYIFNMDQPYDITDLHEILDGDWSQVPEAIQQHINET